MTGYVTHPYQRKTARKTETGREKIVKRKKEIKSKFLLRVIHFGGKEWEGLIYSLT